MITIKTKVGILYMEEESQREEADRIKLYDSNSHYFDYLPLNSIEPRAIWSYCDTVIKTLERIETIDEMLAFLGIASYTASTSWIDLLEDIYGLEGYEYDMDADQYVTLPEGEVITETVISNNEYVNKIGDTFVLLCD